ncbi:MAG: FGGY-family carbohydrate kinase [Sulfuricella sp.]
MNTPNASPLTPHAFLGVDFGTSGARATVIDEAGEILTECRYDFHGEQSAPLWRTALFELIGQIPAALRSVLRAISIDATSATVLLCDGAGEALGAPLLYNDVRASAEAESLAQLAPNDHETHHDRFPHPCPPPHAGEGDEGSLRKFQINSLVATPTSGLAKLLWFQRQPGFENARHLLHQADWLAFQMHGQLGLSDYHNALKTGADPEAFDYPAWIKQLPVAPLLPRIVEPGAAMGSISGRIAHHFALPRDCLVRAGTTDSIAAFLASGARKPGEAVSSLGSTLVLKLLSERRVDSPRHGVYSHRFGQLWLAGGASNSGGAVLRKFFSDAELQSLSRQIDTNQPSGLDYYPLPKAGERFPVNDPLYPPRLTPRPDDPAHFLHGLLEGIAHIEARGYKLLQELGAAPLTAVLSAGGGAHNMAFTSLRARFLGVPIRTAAHAEAAYGSALLARDGARLLYSGYAR